MVHLWAAVLVSDQGLGEDARHGNLVAATTLLLASTSHTKHTFAVANLVAVAALLRHDPAYGLRLRVQGGLA